MADIIRLVLTNLHVLLFVAAIAIAAMKRDEPVATRFLSWILFLSVGGELLWAGLFHIFAPQTAAVSIGWQVSPFQFEVGVADAAAGAVAIISFWRSYEFKAAIGLYTALFYAGVAIGHVREAFEHDNFAPNNFGLMLLLTIVKAVLIPLLLVWARKEAKLESPPNLAAGK